PHEPPGLVVLTDWPYNQRLGDGWTEQSIGAGNTFVVQDSTTPGTPPSVMTQHEAHAPDGAYDITATSHHMFGNWFGIAKEADVALWLKVNAGFARARSVTSGAAFSVW